ncbi:hypothetical protein FHX64_001391 [Microbacter margulisiae]|uniref:Uncharacterized protein n=1 Tax=Microbacter margulisiae TaxID=1350067 RepID=A0A7W5DS38_9PORP|nr:hypothetical protein [Microbacter margulisiae]
MIYRTFFDGCWGGCRAVLLLPFGFRAARGHGNDHYGVHIHIVQPGVLALAAVVLWEADACLRYKISD